MGSGGGMGGGGAGGNGRLALPVIKSGVSEVQRRLQ